ncbi:SET domain-containing protein [Ralstonia pseudosolanacearum]|uniref:SET domain-containing protein n=2 Tax=Ralstonia pseudosolanacearum TaxID=1310165 RepID=UPI0007D85ECC|nr:SET domain-containing protein [Ralstonia pseudosolanacearum]MDD7787910.1 SET domain-containing protein [Ralstonia pseudosolanacearum]OAK92507.1 hypothetical protein AB851_04300 [Ralstonia pseudosolanacearum]
MTVTMRSLPADALGEQIQTRILAADHIPGLVARCEYMHGLVPELKAAIMALRATEFDHDAIMRCIETFHVAVSEFKAKHAFERLPYSPEIDARYPFRDEAFNSVYIGSRDALVRPFDASHDFDPATVWPYLDASLAPPERAQLYHGKILCRIMQSADLKHPGERDLIGQRGVFATREIQPGECLGIYGGRLMTPAIASMCLDDSFVLSCSTQKEECFIDGENILAMTNTIFAYEDDCPVAQAEDGYNTVTARFNATSRCGRSFSVGASFATAFIAPGTELRWNYNYSPEQVRNRFSSVEQ